MKAPHRPNTRLYGYAKQTCTEALHLCHSQPPALVVGDSSTVFRDHSQQAILFHVSRNLAYTRPELFLARAFSSEGLRDIFLGLCSIYAGGLLRNKQNRAAERWAKRFERLPHRAIERLRAPSRDVLQELGTPQPLKTYFEAVEKTAVKVGFFAAGDLNASMRALQEGGDGAFPLPMQEKLRELLLFSVSQEYLTLRRIKGMSIVDGRR